MNNFPNLLLVGAPRCGSTTMQKFIGEHSEAFSPINKEPHYFCRELVGNGPKSLGSTTIHSEVEYSNLYNSEEAVKAKIRGDYSIGYLTFHKEVIPLVKNKLGQPRILIILRNPVDRAFSSYLLHKKTGVEKLSFKDAISDAVESERAKQNLWFGFQHRRISLYSESVSKYLKEFSDVKVVIFEELFDDSKRVIEELFEFLDLKTPHQGLCIPPRENSALLPYSTKLAWILTKMGSKIKPIQGVCNALKKTLSYKPQIDAELRAELKDYFSEDVAKLESILNRSLSLWK